jgi:hypothetical protein
MKPENPRQHFSWKRPFLKNVASKYVLRKYLPRTKSPWVLALVIVVVALTRLVPHPPNFSPVVAMALFGGAALMDKKLAFVVPMAAMLLADFVIGFHDTMVFVYLGMALVVAFGQLLAGYRNPLMLVGGAIVGSGIFFLISNTGMWWLSGVYQHSIEGLLMCFAAALPFFHNTLIATVCYSALLFGAEYWIGRPTLEENITLS